MPRQLNEISSLLYQAAINVIAYCKTEFKSLIEIKNNRNIISNMCGIVEGDLNLLQGKIFLNNSIVSIIHQFDRFESYSTLGGFNLNRRNYKFD